MCRIAGLIQAGSTAAYREELVGRMCWKLQHGGPDDEGILSLTDHPVTLGHRRLSIIDTSKAGHQPMSWDQQQYQIVYNGEIYNYKELRTELEQLGINFKTRTDTEVILAAYAQWGTLCFKRFRGMYAMAIWDQQAGELMLVRDPGGIKPLYYGIDEKVFAFASEVRALKEIPVFHEQREDWPVFFLAYGHLPEPVTTQKNVYSLEKGGMLIYNSHTGEIRKDIFQFPNFMERVDMDEEAMEQIGFLMQQSVNRHLIADAPLGVFLSGGLDSSIIAVLASREIPGLQTNSIYFDHPGYSERKYQQMLVDQLKCVHNDQLVTQSHFTRDLPGIVEAMDLPCCDGINTWYISKTARENGLKTVLSGIGSDELFGGYPSFERMPATLALSRLPDFLLRSGRYASNKKLRRLPYLSIPGANGLFLFLRGQYIPSEIASILQVDESFVWKTLSNLPDSADISHLTAFNQACWLESNMYLQNQLLRDADVMSMAHGIEIRVPFLDYDLLSYVMKIETDVKAAGTMRKQLLIDTFRPLIPEEIWNRPKMGFSFPFKEWFSIQEFGASDSSRLRKAHQELTNGQIHWSQFFTLFLLDHYGR